MQTPGPDEIESEAALRPGQEDDLEHAMNNLRQTSLANSASSGPAPQEGRPQSDTQEPKRPRDRPKGADKPKSQGKSKGKPKSSKPFPNNKYINTESILTPEIIDIDNIDNAINYKGKMTPKEIKFLQLHVSGKYRIIKAMDKAGYTEYSNTYKYLVAKKIIEKYERQADDHRNIFRMVGLGEIAVAKGILKACLTAKTNRDIRESYGLAAKCLGLQREVIEGAQGITLIITGQGDQAGEIKEPGQLAKPQAMLPAPAMIRD